MTSSFHKRLFGPGGCLTALALRNYAEGTLGIDDKKQVEEHIKNCQLCAGALQGFLKHGRNGSIRNDLKYLSRVIRRRYAGRNHEPVKRLSLLVLLTFVALLFMLLVFFYIFRQNYVSRGTDARTPDTVVKTVQPLPDSESVSPSGREDSSRSGR